MRSLLFCRVSIYVGIFFILTSFKVSLKPLPEKQINTSWCPMSYSFNSSVLDFVYASIEDESADIVSNSNFNQWSGSSFSFYGASTIFIELPFNHPNGTLKYVRSGVTIQSVYMPSNIRFAEFTDPLLCGANYEITFE
jgi:hypothetical protein